MIYVPFPLKFRGLKKNALPTDRRTDGRTDGRTDRPTDGRTDRPSYRDAWTHLKMRNRLTDGPTDGRTEQRIDPQIEFMIPDSNSKVIL